MLDQSIYRIGAVAKNGNKEEKHVFVRVAFSPLMALNLAAKAAERKWKDEEGWKISIALLPG